MRPRTLLAILASLGCHQPSMNDEIRKTGSSEGVQFAAEASTPTDTPDTVFLVVKATNRSDGYRTVPFLRSGRCGPSVAFATGRGKATRVWRQIPPPVNLPPNTEMVCTLSQPMARFGPGGTVVTFHAAVPVRTILGDSLPPGLYRGVIGADSHLRGGWVTTGIALR